MPWKTPGEPDPYQFNVNGSLSPAEGPAFCYLFVSFPIWPSSRLIKFLSWLLLILQQIFLEARDMLRLLLYHLHRYYQGITISIIMSLIKTHLRCGRGSSPSFQSRAWVGLGLSSCKFLFYVYDWSISFHGHHSRSLKLTF